MPAGRGIGNPGRPTNNQNQEQSGTRAPGQIPEGRVDVAERALQRTQATRENIRNRNRR
jgi:hypothetical protein